MNNRINIEASVIGIIVGVLLIALSFTIIHFQNPGREAQCIAKSGQVLATPGRISSCLYSNITK